MKLDCLHMYICIWIVSVIILLSGLKLINSIEVSNYSNCRLQYSSTVMVGSGETQAVDIFESGIKQWRDSSALLEWDCFLV